MRRRRSHFSFRLPRNVERGGAAAHARGKCYIQILSLYLHSHTKHTVVMRYSEEGERERDEHVHLCGENICAARIYYIVVLSRALG